MYEERPSTKKIAITVAATVGAIALVVVGGGLLLGQLLAVPGASTPAVSSTPSTPVLAEETATVSSAASASVQPEAAEPEPTPVAPSVAVPTVPAVNGVVCIDAGHQAKADSSLEPIGPGASEKKPKVSGGASGRATGNPESLVNLQISLKLRDELEKRGIKVVMVREKQDVNISNSERAAIANDAKSDLFVRLHCDGSNDSGMTGLSTLVPGRNQWTGPIVASSAEAGRLVHKAVVAATGARDRGVVQRSDLSGFNWSTVPTVLVEMGFMSNSDEDRKLASDEYQQKLATGMADGIVKYLDSK